MAGERPSKFNRERDEDPSGLDLEMRDNDEHHDDSECAVFVTDIARGVTDEMLKGKFREFGNVLEAFVVKNKYTGDTKGYGFVHFSTMDEVYGVLDATELPRFEDHVNHKIHYNNAHNIPDTNNVIERLRVLVVKATMADAKDTLFITNIPRGWEESDLHKALVEIGPDIPRKLRYSASKSTAYASYTDHNQALQCLKNIQRPPSGTAPPQFSAYLAPPRFFDAKNSPSMKVLFVRGISGISQENIRKLFGGPDVVERVVIPIDSTRGGPIGHAFVHFFTTKTAAEAKEKLNDYDYNGKRLSVEWCLPKAHKRAAPAPPPYAYPYPYPPYPYYPPPPPDYEQYYPPPYPYPYDPYAAHSAHHEPREPSHREYRRSGNSDPNPYPPAPSRYPPSVYSSHHSPSSPSHSSYHSSRSPYSERSSSSRSSGYPSGSPYSSSHSSHSSHSPYSSHGSYSSYPPSHPPAHPSSYSSRGSRYVPY